MDEDNIIYDCDCPEWETCPKELEGEDSIECKECQYSSARQKTV